MKWDGERFGVLAAVVGAVSVAATRTKADPDLWGHVRFGQLILEAGELPRSDPYSYLTAGRTWINHEWLSEILFAWSYEIGGSSALIGLKALLALLILLTVYRQLYRRGLGVLRAGMAVVLLSALVGPGVGTVRPQVFTYLFFLIVLLALEAAERGNRKWLWTLPALFAVWVNLHGGFLAGFGVLGIWVVTDLCVCLWQRRDGYLAGVRRPSWLVMPIGVGVLSTTATLLNPYGVELPLFLARTATQPRPEISEWQPLEIASLPGLWYLLLVALVVASLIRSERPKRPGQMVVLALGVLLPLLAVRHLPLFGLAAIVMGADHLAGAFARKEARDRGREASLTLGRVVAVVGTAAGFLLVAVSIRGVDCIELPEGRYPVGAVQLLDGSGASGALAVFFTWGEYAIWHLAPAFPVSMDGRRETVYPDALRAEHIRFIFGTGDWDDHLENGPADVALVPRTLPVFNLLSLKPGWSLVYADSVAGVFARDGWSGAQRLGRQSASRREPGRSCFP